MHPVEFTKEVQRRLGVTADGVPGAVTMKALDAKLPASVAPDAYTGAIKFASPLQSAMTAFYGPAGGGACTAGSVTLPFPFVIAWDTSKTVSRFSCHEKLEAAFTSLWAEAARHYGEAEFRRLRLDRFGGCFNYRKMRGSNSLSIHSWGAAYDVDPERNGFTTTGPTATLSGAAYVPFWNIVEAHGAYSLGRKSNKDWMHFQFARWS
jgi:hypothetical protein